MDWWQALILGLVEGVTEYLPVSSTGHLLLAQRWLRIPASNVSDAYAICIQGGAIAAVLGLYFGRVKQMASGVLGRDPAGQRLAINIVVAFAPAVVLGLLFESTIKTYLFAGDQWGLWPVVSAWFVGGVAILAVGWYRKTQRSKKIEGFDLESLTWQAALIIGFLQCLAMWPGTSRSLVTIVAGVLVGLRLIAAVEFSFLLGLLTLSAATAYDALKHGVEMLSAYGPVNIGIGFLAAWLSAVIAVKWMVSYLTRHGLWIFGWYRIALALVVTALILRGTLDPAPDL